MSNKKVKCQIGLWYESFYREIEADSYEEAITLAKEKMRRIMETDIFDMEYDMDEFTFTEPKAWPNAPKGDGVEYHKLTVSQNFWLRFV